MTAQQTLRGDLEFSGPGLHTGADARVTLRPAEAGSGLRFRLDDGSTFPAHSEYIVETRRATVVGAGERTVSTVEHVLSALLGMGVDNAWIDVAGPEIPVLDGSAATFAGAIAEVGTVTQPLPRATLAVDEPRAFHDGEATVVVMPAERFAVRFIVDFAPPVGAQYFEASITPELYLREIAPGRTFGYLHEVEALRSAGLARGGTLDNALVFAPEGPLTPLRWPNEVVRHKMLDLIGDFALLGAWPQFEVVAIKSGHRLHAQVTRALRARGAVAGGVAGA
ncbi:MAG: UDP-3-O-[3-hydroxymyristoyl] N-acetylglucosamine deacetylase [Candidatus Eremiobacteraeota bacterium]|nr:UDP-3-O-[3-hydroxymyristoyl] N-acetylglucosamine deacetylase [Candidatus Eremiobacteraeota bacterium]